jgi:HKD family nuclease
MDINVSCAFLPMLGNRLLTEQPQNDVVGLNHPWKVITSQYLPFGATWDYKRIKQALNLPDYYSFRTTWI